MWQREWQCQKQCQLTPHLSRDPNFKAAMKIGETSSEVSDCIIDVWVTNLDCKTKCSKDPHKVLAQHERANKKKYLEACTEQRRHFTPSVVSMDGVIGHRLSALLTEKWDQLYLVVCGYMNDWMSIAIARATHLCLGGSCIPTGQMSKWCPQWEDSASLSQFRD
jgi:hypothetical protein